MMKSSLSVESYEGSYSKKISRSSSLKFCLQTYLCDDEFTEPIVAFRGKNTAY